MRLLLRLLAALAAAALAACAGPKTSNLNVNDHGVFVPSVRIAAELAPAKPYGSHAIEAGLSGARGGDTQTLSPSDRPVVFGGETFSGPQELRHEFDFRFYELAYRYRTFIDRANRFGVEGLAGAAYADLKLTVSSPSQRARENLGTAGFVGKLGGLWQFHPGTSLQTRGTLFYSGRTDEVSYAARFELYLAQALGRHAGLRAGYAAWNIRSDREGSSFSGYPAASPVHVRFSGPAVGLDVMF